MNKSEFTEILGAKLAITRTEAERFLNGFILMIYDQLNKHEKVSISGFGQFSSPKRAARKGVNPRNFSQEIIIPEHIFPKFKAGESFKQAIKLKL